MYYSPVSNTLFTNVLAQHQREHEHISAATTPAEELQLSTNDRAYLAPDLASGFAVRASGELVAVFSAVRGRGDGLVASATRRGATHLDCFDGVLPILYARHGFVCTKRVPNYNGINHPDVVYMSRLGPDAY